MFEYFNEDARKIVVGAQEQAKGLKQNFITVEHLFLAIIDTGVQTVAEALTENNATVETMYEHVLLHLSNWDEDNSEPKPKNSALPFTPSGKRVLELSANEAIQTGKHYVQGEHVFLGILRLGEGVVVDWLKDNNVDILAVRSSVVEKLKNQVAVDSGENVVDESKTNSGSKVLDSFCVNMTDVAAKSGFDPVIGRELETSRLIRILARRTKNNPVLTGEPGIGKTAIVELLAQRIIKGQVPEQLKGKIVYNLNMGALIAGTRFRGELEERIEKILKELKANPNIVLFIDEIHSIMGAGDSTESPMNIANQLKPALSRGEVRIIGATTAKEYRRYIEKDAALERRFQQVNVEPPTAEETLLILKGLRDRYEAFHRVTITDDALEAAIYYADRFINDRFFPDKAIDLIDEASAKIKLDTVGEGNADFMLDSQIQEAIRAGDFVEAARLKETATIQDSTDVENGEETPTPEIIKEDIAAIVSEITGIPAYKISDQESTRLKFIEQELSKKVVGQPEAVKTVSKAVRRMRTGIRDISKPISLIFAGSTGVGKTEMAKTLAEYMFDDKNNFITIDMSEYGEQHSTSRLFGAPPGFVGFESGGQLTEHVYRKPYSVVLFDEIEKAHPNIFNTLLQILDEGRMTDGQGRVIDFKNTIIILTTNLGGEELTKQNLGFNIGGENETVSYVESKKIINNILKKNFKPEFLNRLDELVVFHKLTVEDLQIIINNMVKSLNERLFALGYRVELSGEASNYIAHVGYDREQGARPLARAVQTNVEDVISEMIINETLTAGSTVKVDYVDKELVFNIVKPETVKQGA